MVYTFVNTTNVSLGAYSPEKPVAIYSVKKKTQANVFAKGDILAVDLTTGGYFLAATTDKRSFAVVYTPSVATDLTVSCIHEGEVILKASAAIPFGKEVMPAGGGPTVKVWDGVSREAVIGQYVGHPGEGDEAYPQTDAVALDLIKVNLASRS